ncbi:MAG: TolC family protein, partial [Rhodovarius sp.]|nr:TolC family protein [Rhodovarius sp.]
MRFGPPLLALGLLAAALVPPPALAQQGGPAPAGREAPAEPRVLTLEAAERLLVERNLAVIAARRGVDAARAQRIVASSPPPAQFAVGNSFLQFQETPAGRITRPRGYGPSHNISTTLTVIVELGGKRTLRTRLAEENIGVAEAQVLDALRTQLFELRQGFINALAARANLELALANRLSLDRTEALLRRRVRDGAMAEADLLRFQASRVPFDAEVASAAQAYTAAVAALAAILAADAAERRNAPVRIGGLALDLPFEPRGRFEQAPEPPLSREELAEAVQNRPDVVAALRQAAAAGANRSLAEAARWRDVTISAGYGRSRLPQDLPTLPGGATAFANNEFRIEFGIPLFTRRIVEGQIGVATHEAARAEAEARAALLRARADFATAWSQVEQARAQLRLYTSGALARAEQAYRATEAAYLAGAATLIDVLDALRTRNATRLAANEARAAYLRALA